MKNPIIRRKCDVCDGNVQVRDIPDNDALEYDLCLDHRIEWSDLTCPF